jgi:hypothetical protein
MKRRLGPRRQESGFTLVELMVAVTGALFVTMAVFVLSKQTTSIYQSEARISNATLGSVVGFERLRADIERAGYLTTPNLVRDPKLCGFPDATWPHAASTVGQYQQHLSSVFITRSAAADIPPELTGNKITPDEITLAGSYASVDQFPTGAIFDDGTYNVVTLQVASPPMARLGYDTVKLPSTGDLGILLSSVFGPGRILRIVDTVGREQYARIHDVTVDSLTSPPKIRLDKANSNEILYRGTSAQFQCGIQGLGERSLVNVVNLVRYSLRNLSTDTRYAPLYDKAGMGPSTDSGRGELVREELDAAGSPILDSNDKPVSEVVTEFAVDLSFGITVSQIVTTGGGPPIEQLATLTDPAVISSWAGQTWGTSAMASGGASNTVAPQLLRAVRVRLGVRSREADRLTGMPTFGDGGTTPVMPGLYRVGLGPSGAAPFARVRTLQADVVLRNHRGATWL